MSAPNVEGTQNAAIESGGVFGSILGQSASEPAGLHGSATVQSAHIATIGNSATGAQIATAVNAIIAALIAKGVIAAS
jgi:hypothetical protein